MPQRTEVAERYWCLVTGLGNGLIPVQESLLSGVMTSNG